MGLEDSENTDRDIHHLVSLEGKVGLGEGFAGQSRKHWMQSMRLKFRHQPLCSGKVHSCPSSHCRI